MLWAVLAFLALMTSAILAWPLVKRRNTPSPRIDFDLAVYRVQLEEIEKDRQRGFLDKKDADSARLEIHRRMLAADVPVNIPANGNKRVRNIASRIAAAIVILAILPGASFGIYHYIGAPQMATLQNASFANAVTQNYTENGNNFFAKHQYDQAAEAYKKAIGLDPRNEQAWTLLGESLALRENGTITEDSRVAFAHAYFLNPDNTKAEFSLAVAAGQSGDYRKAVAILHDVKANSPSDAPWNETVDQEISRYAKQGGFNAASVPTTAPTDDVRKMLNL